ncbi:MAG: hypothetical protein ABH830_02765 [Patescibacteria group bacterium]
MKHSMKKGFSFGLTSGIITTLGLMVGLNSSTHSKLVVIGGILVIAIADAMSDALGMHISEEAESCHTNKQVWIATIFTFLAKFFFAIIFIIPVILFTLSTAVYFSIGFGLLLIMVFSFYIAKQGKIKPYKVIFEHLLIAVLVIIITYYVGNWVGGFSSF